VWDKKNPRYRSEMPDKKNPRYRAPEHVGGLDPIGFQLRLGLVQKKKICLHPSHRMFGHMYGVLNVDKKN
jgi:hypothetical protein